MLLRGKIQLRKVELQALSIKKEQKGTKARAQKLMKG
jgi:hypothetical protein